MNIIILGSNGMLGSDIVSVLSKHTPFTIHGYDKNKLDITNPDELMKLKEKHPHLDLVINCAAYTAVDDCESNNALAVKINGESLKSIADFCKKSDCVLMHFSTDYVFDGKKKLPYTELDPTNPISVYGNSKHIGERHILESGCMYYLFRVQWLFGKNGHHFIKTLVNLSKTKDTISVVDDQWGSPTSTNELAKAVLHILTSKKQTWPKCGLYHLSSSSYTNWFEYAVYVCKKLNLPLNITPTTSEKFIRPAARPKNGRLDSSLIQKTLGISLPPWQVQVDDYIQSV